MEDPNVFQEKVRNSFQKVKEDISNLKAEINEIKGILNEIRNEIKDPKLNQTSEGLESPPPNQEEVSIGNQGVQANVQANKQTNKQANVQANIVTESKNSPFLGIEWSFKNLTKQEFHIFLLIYQLEEEKINPTYDVLSKRLSLTLSCLRGHICNIIKKGIPLSKKMLRDHSVVLYIDRDFKAIASQKKLLDFYYSAMDPGQKRLTDI